MKTSATALLTAALLLLGGCGKDATTSTGRTAPSRFDSPEEIAAAIQNLPLATTSGALFERGYTASYESRQAEGEPNSLRLTSPNGKLVDLPMSIADALNDYRNARHITSLSIPVDEKNPNILYLSTSRALNKDYSHIENELYRYDLTKRELTSIYKELSTNGTLLRTVGRDSSFVVIFRDSAHSRPGPCSEPWYSFRTSMAALDTNHPEQGLHRYHVPEKRMLEAKTSEETCAINLGATP